MNILTRAAVALALVAPAAAEEAEILISPGATQALDFGAWCDEIARYPADRCAEALPDDKSAYDRYAESVNLFENEKIARDESRRIEAERVDRMGDVTPDQTRGSAFGR